MSPAEVYAQLRRTGRVELSGTALSRAEQESIASSARRLGRKDGLKVLQYRERGSSSVFRYRPSILVLNLVHPDRPSVLVAPDATPLEQKS